MATKLYLVLLLLLTSLAYSETEYKIINNTCMKVTTLNDTLNYTEVDMEICKQIFEEQQPKIILYEKPKTERCYTNDDCPAGEVCNKDTGICEKPKEPSDLTTPGIVAIILILFAIFSIRK